RTDAESQPQLRETWRTFARSRRSEERTDAPRLAWDRRAGLRVSDPTRAARSVARSCRAQPPATHARCPASPRVQAHARRTREERRHDERREAREPARGRLSSGAWHRSFGSYIRTAFRRTAQTTHSRGAGAPRREAHEATPTPRAHRARRAPSRAARALRVPRPNPRAHRPEYPLPRVEHTPVFRGLAAATQTRLQHSDHHARRFGPEEAPARHGGRDRAHPRVPPRSGSSSSRKPVKKNRLDSVSLWRSDSSASADKAGSRSAGALRAVP